LDYGTISTTATTFDDYGYIYDPPPSSSDYGVLNPPLLSDFASMTISEMIFDESKEESVIFDGRYFTISDTSFSGTISIRYLCNKYLVIVPFSIYVSGIAQVVKAVQEILVSVSGSADAYNLKGATALITAISSMYAENPSLIKYVYPEIHINFEIGSEGYCIKNTSEDMSFGFGLSDAVSINRNAYSDIIYRSSGSATGKIGIYATLNDYASSTLNDMKDYTLNELLFISLS